MKKRQIETIKNLGLATFERKLQNMAKEGDLHPTSNESVKELIETQPVSLTEEDRQRFLSTVKKASHEKILREASKKVRKAELPFGRHLQTIRDKGGLSQADIAKLLNKPLYYIEKIESGKINPMSMLAADIVNIMQLFRLTLTDLKATTTAFLHLSLKPTGNISVMGRSSIKTDTKERGDGLGHAMDAVLQAIAKKNAKQEDTLTIDSSFLQSIQELLKNRGEKDLLI